MSKVSSSYAYGSAPTPRPTSATNASHISIAAGLPFSAGHRHTDIASHTETANHRALSRVIAHKVLDMTLWSRRHKEQTETNMGTGNTTTPAAACRARYACNRAELSASTSAAWIRPTPPPEFASCVSAIADVWKSSAPSVARWVAYVRAFITPAINEACTR